MHEIETERYLLRPLAAADAAALHRLWTRPEVRRYLWDDRVVATEETAAVLAESARLFRERGFGLWGVWPRETGALAGFGGFWHFRDPPELELLLGVAPERWGGGVATEAGRALVRYAFEVLGFDEVRASTDAPNRAAVRVMEKLGMTFVRRAEVAGLDTIFYVIRDRRGSPGTLWT